MSLKFVNLMNESYDFQLKTLDWRNSDDVNIFFQINKISIEQHKNWLDLLKNQPQEQVAFVVYFNEKPIGVTYFRNINSESCQWGIYIFETSLRGQGIGQKTLSWSVNYAKTVLKVKRIELEVKNSNIAAIKCYEKLGFVLVREKNDNFLCYEKTM